MFMNFNFNSLSETNFAAGSTNYLKAYDIYEVNLTKIAKDELKGSKDPNAVYPVITLEFTGCGDNKGVFTKNLFVPVKEEDFEPAVLTNANGHESKRPSRFDEFKYCLMQLVHIINPEGEKKIKENASKIKTIDQFVDLVIKAIANKSDVKFNLKLVGRNSNGTVYADLPRACGMNKAGEVFNVPFVGDNLSFTPYELTQMKAYQNAKPTPMKEEEAEDTSEGLLDDFDL